MPPEIIDVTLCERFGWTWAELDEQDMSRVLPSVAAANIYAAVSRVMPALDAAALSGDLSRAPRAEDLNAWNLVQAARDTRKVG